MNRFLAFVLVAGLSLTALACGRPFDVKTAPGFVEIDNQETYQYRSMSPEGVVMGIRAVPLDDKGDLAFWTRAVTLRMRQLNGYALIASADVKSRDGTQGKELVFGHDENGKPFIYALRLFVAQDRLFIVEAGGQKEQVERYKASLDWMQSSVKVKCDTIVSPVLASRTCNKW